MKIIIVGIGKVGKTLAEVLLKEGHDVVLVDQNSKRLEQVGNKSDVMCILGGGSERRVLLEAEADKADFFISCTPMDELNILCCILAKNLGARYTIARVRDPEHYKEMAGLKNDIGLDLVFNPEYRTASEIASMLKFPSAIKVENFSDIANLVEFHIGEGNSLIGKPLKEITQGKNKILIALVRRGQEVIIPRGDFVIQKGDFINTIGVDSEIQRFCRKMNIYKPHSRSVFIIGGGKIAFYLAKKLIQMGVSVKILESDENRCIALSESLSKATILLGDGTDQSVLEEEDLAKCDACVTLTGIDEENVIISLYALQQNVSKVVTKVDHDSVQKMVKMFGLDTIVSPKDIIANTVLCFVRSHQAESGEGINTLYKLYDKAEALEFTATNEFVGLNIPLKKLKIRSNILIGGLVRNGEFIIANGDTCIEKGDKVIVLAKSKQIKELADILR